MPGLDVLDTDAIPPGRVARGPRRTWCEHESPSRDKPSLDSLARKLADRLEAIGGEVEVDRQPERGRPPPAPGSSATIRTASRRWSSGHFDTVWPLGTLAKMPFRVEGDGRSGPGVFDMKASLVEAEFAIDALRSSASAPPGRSRS